MTAIGRDSVDDRGGPAIEGAFEPAPAPGALPDCLGVAKRRDEHGENVAVHGVMGDDRHRTGLPPICDRSHRGADTIGEHRRWFDAGGLVERPESTHDILCR